MTTVIDRSGQQRELQDGETLQDGDRLIVKLNMMDHSPLVLDDGMGNAAGHKPGYVFAGGAAASMSDAALDVARSETEAKLTSAWRSPASKREAAVADADHQDAYAAYEARLATAWRTP